MKRAERQTVAFGPRPLASFEGGLQPIFAHKPICSGIRGLNRLHLLGQPLASRFRGGSFKQGAGFSIGVPAETALVVDTFGRI